MKSAEILPYYKVKHYIPIFTGREISSTNETCVHLMLRTRVRVDFATARLFLLLKGFLRSSCGSYRYIVLAFCEHAIKRKTLTVKCILISPKNRNLRLKLSFWPTLLTSRYIVCNEN
jgi:hypothetical protein